jgi:hypothetical protein
MLVTTLRVNAKSTCHTVLACAVGLAIACAWTPARAGDDETAPDIKFLQGLLEGIGLKSGREKQIDYHERSPLVIPPSNTLLPPEKDATTSNPNWPVDPEVKRQKEFRAAERAKSAGSSSDQFITDARPLPPSELNKGPHKGSERNAANTPNDSELIRPLSPSELGTKKGLLSGIFGKADDAKTARFTGEPSRASLTDPPPGYQTPSANQVYGEAKEVYKPKAEDYYLTHPAENAGR